MTKKELQTKLNKAVDLLEEIHSSLNNGASYDGKISLIPDITARNKVQWFVKSINLNTKLKYIKTEYYPQTFA